MIAEPRIRRLGQLLISLMVVVGLDASTAPSSDAHKRSLSYSNWEQTEDGMLRVRLRVTRLDLSRLPWDPWADSETGGKIPSYLSGRLGAVRGDDTCTMTSRAQPLQAPDGWAVFEWKLRCTAADVTAIVSRLFADVAPSHLHFARVARPDGSVEERVLSDGQETWPLPFTAADTATDAPQGTGFAGYVLLGIEHILTGYDHLAFVAALLLLAPGLREVAALVTSFTVAHSITLALATLGLVRPEAGSVEALIGFSIALVAAENAWLLAGRGTAVPAGTLSLLVLLLGLRLAGTGGLTAMTLAGLALFSSCHFALLRRTDQPGRLRAAVTFGFGLVHGFGFAGILAEMDLPTERLVPALLGFNVGVELGQLGIVALLWPALRFLSRRESVGRSVAEVGSAAICGLGLFWFLTRLF